MTVRKPLSVALLHAALATGAACSALGWPGSAAIAAHAAVSALQPGPSDTDRFNAILESYDSWRNAAYPESALRRGIEDFAGELTDTSIAGVHKRQAALERLLDELRTIDASKLSAASQINPLDGIQIDLTVNGNRIGGTLFPFDKLRMKSSVNYRRRP